MALHTLFPTFVYYDSLHKKRSTRWNDELLDECLKIRDFDRRGRAWSKKHYVGGYTSYASMPQLHQFSSTFDELEKKIRPHVNKYIRSLEVDLGGREVRMSDCWLNIMPAQTSHGLHLHPLSFISGTYYVSTPRGCGEIQFEDPRLPGLMAAPPRKASASVRNKTFVRFQPVAGKLILFESWLRHEVPAAAIDEERVSISFNYCWG